MNNYELCGTDCAAEIKSCIDDLIAIYKKVSHLSVNGISPAILVDGLSPL